MNFALPAILFFFIVLPGFVFRSRLKLVERSSLDYSPFGSVVTEGVCYAAALHAVALLLVYLFPGKVLRIDILLRMLASESSKRGEDIVAIAKNIEWVGLYSFGILVAAFLIPSGIRWGITRFRLDRYGARLSFLCRFHRAPWYYLLSGADFLPADEPDAVGVAAVTNVAGEPYVYQGILYEYFLNGDGQLDRLVLSKVSRRAMKDDKAAGYPTESLLNASANSERFHVIDGDYFVLRYDEAINLNILYVKFESAAEVQAREESVREASESHDIGGMNGQLLGGFGMIG